MSSENRLSFQSAGAVRKNRPPRINQEAARIASGMQCPECFGVRIVTNYVPHIAAPDGFGCQECGCQWGLPLCGND